MKKKETFYFVEVNFRKDELIYIVNKQRIVYLNTSIVLYKVARKKYQSCNRQRLITFDFFKEKQEEYRKKVLVNESIYDRYFIISKTDYPLFKEMIKKFYVLTNLKLKEYNINKYQTIINNLERKKELYAQQIQTYTKKLIEVQNNQNKTQRKIEELIE